MANDYEDAINLDQMDDDDVGELIRQRLDEDNDFDVDAVDIEVHDGRVVVEGRVGSEGERQLVDQVLSALGAVGFDNNVVVDENARGQRPAAADDAAAENAETTSALGESGDITSDTASHLQPDDRGDMYGTSDPGKATEEGQSYTPPDGPTQEGIEGDERH